MPLAYCNGQFVPAEQLSVAVYDQGFVMGVTVSEQMRTFAGRLFRLEQHLERLQHSLQVIGVAPPVTIRELAAAAQRLVEHNHPLLRPGDDLGLSLFVTPGPYGAFAPAEVSGPTLGLHTYPVAFSSFADKYERGESLVVTNVRQVPSACWPPELKCRSRMHYYLADMQARHQEPGARALLLDLEGRVTEASTANILLYDPQRGIVSPPAEHILPGITIAALRELAEPLGVPFVHRELRVEDLLQAHEVFLCSTSPCILPVVRIQGQAIGDGRPGPLFRRLLQAWSEHVGVEIAAQARQFARRSG